MEKVVVDEADSSPSTFIVTVCASYTGRGLINRSLSKFSSFFIGLKECLHN